MKDKKDKRKGPEPSAAARDLKSLPTRAPGGYKHRSFVFYGRSGTGKTTVFSTFPGKKLLLDIKDAGDDSLTGAKDVEVMDIRHWDDMEMAYWWLKRNTKAFSAVGLDTMSQLQQLCIRKVLEDKGKDPDRAGEWGVMTKQDWGAVASLMKMWIINWRDLPMNVVFIAQDRTFNTGDEGDDGANGLSPEVGPGLSPSIAKHLNAAVHLLANTFIRRRTVVVKVKNPPKGKPPRKEVEKVEFCLRVGPNATYVTKVRKAKSISLPSVVVDPTYEKLLAIIEGVSK